MLIEDLRKAGIETVFVTLHVGYGTFQPIQIAATVTLNEAADFPTEVNAVYQKRRDQLCDGLKRIGWDIEPPKGTMFVWAPIPEQYSDMKSIEFASFLVKEANVAVSPGVGFGRGGEGGHVGQGRTTREEEGASQGKPEGRFLEIPHESCVRHPASLLPN